MKIKLKNLVVFFVALFVFVPVFAFAHQPRITKDLITTVSSPEISKAYYAKLEGEGDKDIEEWREKHRKFFSKYYPSLFSDESLLSVYKPRITTGI